MSFKVSRNISKAGRISASLIKKNLAPFYTLVLITHDLTVVLRNKRLGQGS